MGMKIVGGLIVIIAVLAGVVAMQPADMTVTREAKMSASPDIVFAQVNNLHAFDAWSPWAKKDPAMEKTFSGAPEGVGAVLSWKGNKEVGSGSQTITASKAPERIDFKLDFLEPFPSTADASLVFAAEGDGTKVTWSTHANRTFVMKAIGLVCNMDQMIGADFEKGLTALAAVSETKAKEAQAAAAAAAAQQAQAAAEPAPPAPAPEAPKKKKH